MTSSISSNLLKDSNIGKIDYTEISYLINNDNYIVLKIWDTSGQEAFNALSSNLFNGAEMILLMYDITNSNSFTEIDEWIHISKEKMESYAKFALVGNKCDLKEDRKVKEEEGKEYAEKNKLSIFQEISTFTGQNINLLFEKIVKVLFLQIINCERNLDAELDTNSISGLDHSQRNNSNSFYLSSKSKKNHNSCSC